MREEDKFYNKDWFMVLALIFLAPIGIWLMYRNKRFSKIAKIILSVFFSLIFLFEIIMFIGITAGSGQDTKVQPKQMANQNKNFYGLKSTDLAKIKDVEKNGDVLIVSASDTSSATDKSKLVLPFRMATNDIVKQVKSNNINYKTLKIKDYKGNKNIFTATFSKNKIDTINSDINFMEIMDYADKVSEDDLKSRKNADTQDTSTNSQEYVNKMIGYLNTLSGDAQNVNNAISNSKDDELKDFCDYVVRDCKNIESIKPQNEFEDIQNKINQACDIYINFYGQVYNKAENGDIDWINQQKSSVEKANNLMKEVTKEVNTKNNK